MCGGVRVWMHACVEACMCGGVHVCRCACVEVSCGGVHVWRCRGGVCWMNTLLAYNVAPHCNHTVYCAGPQAEP